MWLVKPRNFMEFLLKCIVTIEEGNHRKPIGSACPEVCVHGDAHLGNIMWHRGQLRLIDFDMTAVGPAGADAWPSS